ncbi:hypothetical protein GZH46_00415, partial [Fragariocoptes setiger]
SSHKASYKDNKGSLASELENATGFRLLSSTNIKDLEILYGQSATLGCLALACLASAQAQYQSLPYSQRKMAPTPAMMANSGASSYGGSQSSDYGSGDSATSSSYGSKSSGYGSGAGTKGGYGGKSSGYGQEEKPMPYAFGFESDDGYGTTQERHEAGDASGEVKGHYGYKDPAGIYRQVEYTAGAAGFNAVVKTNEPGVGSTENPADVQFIVETPPEGSYAARSNGYGGGNNGYGSGSGSDNGTSSYGGESSGSSYGSSGSAGGSKYGASGSMGSSGGMGYAASSDAMSSSGNDYSSQRMGSGAGYGGSSRGSNGAGYGSNSGKGMSAKSSGYSSSSSMSTYGSRGGSSMGGYGRGMSGAQRSTPSMSMMMRNAASAYGAGMRRSMVGDAGASKYGGSSKMSPVAAAMMSTQSEADEYAETPTYNSKMSMADAGAQNYGDSQEQSYGGNAMGQSKEFGGYSEEQQMQSGYGDSSMGMEGVTKGGAYGSAMATPQLMMTGFETSLKSGGSSGAYSSGGSGGSMYGGAAGGPTKMGGSGRYSSINGMMMKGGMGQRSMGRLRQYQQIPVHPKGMNGMGSNGIGSNGNGDYGMSSRMEMDSGASEGSYGQAMGGSNGSKRAKTMALSMIKMLNMQTRGSKYANSAPQDTQQTEQQQYGAGAGNGMGAGSSYGSMAMGAGMDLAQGYN